MKRNYVIEIRGREHVWGLNVRAEPEHVEDWRADGLVVDEVIATIPEWVVDLGLLRPYVRVQEWWQWLRLW